MARGPRVRGAEPFRGGGGGTDAGLPAPEFPDSPKEGRENFREESLEEELTRKNAELKRVRKFMRSRRRKTEFEQEFLNHFEGFYGEAEAALEAARSRGLRVLYEKSLAEGWLCHGDYNQHHVLLSREGTAITDFGRCHFGVQTGDLAHFFRKILEKQNWDKVYGNAMLREYGRVRPLSGEEQEDLRVRLSYPEKFWKLADHYYGSRKSWIPEKNVEKLRSLIRQRDAALIFSQNPGIRFLFGQIYDMMKLFRAMKT